MTSKRRAFAVFFILIDILAITALVVVAIVITLNPLDSFFAFDYKGIGTTFKQSSSSAYDPYVWLALLPLEFVTFVINVGLVWS